ncbi:MAG: hypothetical protein KYX64_09525 [Sphingopyxis sp.]|nr:hypothetical protein [Sphingopyxis sp.]
MKAATETITEMLALSDAANQPNIRSNARAAKSKGKLRHSIKLLSEMFGGSPIRHDKKEY